jgi:hypothetical protein
MVRKETVVVQWWYYQDILLEGLGNSCKYTVRIGGGALASISQLDFKFINP